MRWFSLVLCAACSFTGAAPDQVDDDPDAAPDIDAAVSADGGPDANAFRRTVQITPPNSVSGPVNNVVVPIRLSADQHLMMNAEPTGQDIAVYLTDGTQLAVDFEILDPTQGELLVWVAVPTVEQTGTELHLYYGVGNSAPEKLENPWFGLADLVWHFQDTGGTPVAIDASPSDIDGTQQNGTITSEDCIYGQGLHNNGAQILMESGANTDRDANDSFAIAIWFNQQTAISGLDFAFHNGGPIDNVPGYEIALGTGNWSFGIRDTGGDEAQISFGNEGNLGNGWQQLVGVVDRSDDSMTAYVNGVAVDSANIADLGDMRGPRLGRHGGGANPPNAFVDEMRAYVIAPSADYIALDYAMAQVPGTLEVEAAEAVRYPGT